MKTNSSNWIRSTSEFATIIDATTCKQIADFGSPQLPEHEIERNLALALRIPKMVQALERAEFLLRRISQGDHHALDNAEAGVDQCRDALANVTSSAGRAA